MRKRRLGPPERRFMSCCILVSYTGGPSCASSSAGRGPSAGCSGGPRAKPGSAFVLVDKLEAHVAAINGRGLVLKGVHGTHVLRVPAVRQARDVQFQPGDVAVLAVKSFH